MVRDTTQIAYLEIRISPLIGGGGRVEIIRHLPGEDEKVLISFSGLSDKREFNKFINELRKILRGYIKHGLINLAKIPWINSTGLGQLILIQQEFHSLGGHFVLVSPNSRLRDIFMVTELNKVFTIVDTLAEAIENFEENVGGGCT